MPDLIQNGEALCTRVLEIRKVFMCASCSSSVLDLYRSFYVKKLYTDICTEFSFDPNVTKIVLL
jgi:hypothetical protein